jgi:glycosyltransferase involved in cell wall biosynthesis
MVRTRDEERNIGPFCEAYQEIADKILVADGGSEDNTIKIASSFANVEIRNFPERTPLARGHWRNNDSDHVNFLISWAKEYEADWIIHDDCDSRPNYLLRRHTREILAQVEQNVVMVVRVYLWGQDQHFPNMTKLKPVEKFNYMTSLWAWRPHTNLWTFDKPPAYTLMIGDEIAGDLHDSTSVFDLMPPYCLVHHTWDDQERTLEKIRVYRESGLIPNQSHPLNYAGPVESLPGWARE